MSSRGTLLSSGTLKSAYTRTREPKIVYLYVKDRSNTHMLQEEHDMLQYLHRMGVPEVVQNVRMVEEGKDVALRLELVKDAVMVWKPHNVSDTNRLLDIIKTWDAGAVTDLAEQISACIDSLEDQKILVYDLQFMVVPPRDEHTRPRIVLFDPYEVQRLDDDARTAQKIPQNQPTTRHFQRHWTKFIEQTANMRAAVSKIRNLVPKQKRVREEERGTHQARKTRNGRQYGGGSRSGVFITLSVSSLMTVLISLSQ